MPAVVSTLQVCKKGFWGRVRKGWANLGPGGDGDSGSCCCQTQSPLLDLKVPHGSPWFSTSSIADAVSNRPIWAAGPLHRVRQPKLSYPEESFWIQRRLFLYCCTMATRPGIGLGLKSALELWALNFRPCLRVFMHACFPASLSISRSVYFTTYNSVFSYSE